MPLNTADGSIDRFTLQTVPEKFILFYSSIVDSELWCPDCRDVDPLVQAVFTAEGSPSALIVYVGDRQQWKTPENLWRQEPWHISSIPTIVRIENGKPGARLVETEITSRLEDFVKE